MSSFDRLHPSLQHHIVNSLGWPRLRPTQEDAIAPVLDGRDVLLLAPTAGGKTEAAIFPVLSRMLSERWTGLSVLYVCPLRALLNNLEPRLAHYAGLVGRSVALWHGDVGASKKRLASRSPPDLLLTTPESIESILISRHLDHRDFFSNVRIVIVDELHAFAGDDRGWHLVALLERLDRITGRHIQRIGLSATIGNPERLACWLAQTGQARVVGSQTGPADGDVTIDYVGSLENAALVISQLHRGEKRLVFCDSRARVESLAAGLRNRGQRTFVCHSSLSSAERRQAEEAFAQSSDCVIVATSALELGIDVGDLDRVIQIDAPPTVASFLQRMGRTGRRAGTQRNCLFLATSTEALLIAMGVVRLWAEGAVEKIVPPQRPLHILSQQILALILQENGLPHNGWSRWIGKTFRTAEPSDIEALVAHMSTAGIIVDDQGVLGVGPAGEAAFGRRNFLDLVSAFTTPLLISVRYGNSVLGEVAPATFSHKQDGPSVLLLGGRSWRVTGVEWKRRIAWVEPHHDGGKSLWRGSSRSIAHPICRSIETTLVKREPAATLSHRAQNHFDALCEEYGFCDGECLPLVAGPDDRSRLWTFAGSAANGPLAHRLAAQGMPGTRFDNFSLSARTADVEQFARAFGRTEPAASPAIVPAELEHALKFSVCLPPGLASEILAERLYDAVGLKATLARPIRIVRASGG